MRKLDFFEAITEAKERIKSESMPLEKVLEGIAVYRKQIHDENAWTDPVKLSDVALKLAVYNSYLADHLADAHKEATDKQHSVYLECLKEGEGTTKAEQIARGESTEERRYYENLKFVYGATESIMSRIQTKIRTIENQINREGQA